MFDPSATQVERERGGAFAQSLSMSVLSRAWQILLKGVEEVKDSPRPLPAADMVLVRLAYAADLPSPEEALKALAAAPSGGVFAGALAARRAVALGRSRRRLARGPASGRRRKRRLRRPRPRSTIRRRRARRVVAMRSFAELVALAAEKRDIQIKTALERDVRLVRFEQGVLEFSLAPGGFAGACGAIDAQIAGLDRPALDGGAVVRAGRADA